METQLDNDVLEKIFRRLDDPSDIARASCVSCHWRYVVIANGLAKQLCLRMFPQLSKVDHVVESAPMAENPVAVGPGNMEWETLKKEHRAYAFLARGFMSFLEKHMDVAVGPSNMEWETLKKEHRAYAFLARGFMSFPEEEKCISKAIIASSTDHFPQERIDNTLEKDDIVGGRPSYWSSKGSNNPVDPETRTYKLVADLSVVTEIKIKPFKVYFDWDFPICSANSVRFRMGHSHGDKFVWTYTSQEFCH